MTATEIAQAYVALTTKMPNVKKDIEEALGNADSSGAGKRSAGLFSAGFAGAVGGAIASVTSKAMSVISGSIDAAISRVDTMNNFPKIMQNLGYSADDAADSIAVMSTRLTGLPTSLNAMAGVVQQLAPLTGSLAEATDLSLAFNNALLAGGKSTEIQANALDQYVQMLAVGKVDMAAWRSIVSAMPGQVNQLAQSLLGAEAGQMDLYNAMQTGTIGFDQFNAAILALNNEGVNGFASFAEQAKSSTDGIATSQANLQTAITRTLATLIQEFQPAILAVTGALTSAVNATGPLIMGIIDGGKAIVDWVAANRDWLGVLLAIAAPMTAVVVAIKAAQIATVAWTAITYGAAGASYASGIALNIHTIAMNAYTVASRIATAAQAAWNAVVNANPILLIVTALAALVAGLVYFFTQTELGREIWANVTAAIGAAVTWLWENVLQPVFTAIGAIFEWVYNNIIVPIVTGILLYIGLWAAIITWLWETILSPVFKAIGDVFNWIYNNVIIPIVNGVIAYFQAWGQIITWLYSSIVKPIFDAVGAAFNWVWSSVISPVAKFISDAITNVGNTIRSVFSGVAGFIGAAFQSVLGVVRGPINALISMINNVIGGLNSVKVDIPDWVPGVGGQRFGLSIPKIPMLADGGVISASRGGTLAVVGEGRYDEAVLPLSPEVLGALGGGGIRAGDSLRLVVGDEEFTAYVDARADARGASRGGAVSRSVRNRRWSDA